MLKKHMAACLVATAFMAAPALAQTSSSSSSASSGAAASHSGQFMTHMNPDQWRGSKLVGVNIYGQNNEKIGDVNEVLIDRKGNADAIVVGVGGFLGMGEKDVALPFSAVEWKYDRNDLSTASTNRPATTRHDGREPAGLRKHGGEPAGDRRTGADDRHHRRQPSGDRRPLQHGPRLPGPRRRPLHEGRAEERADVPLQHERRHLARKRPGPHHGPGEHQPAGKHDGSGDGAEAVSRTAFKSDEGPRRKAGPFWLARKRIRGA